MSILYSNNLATFSSIIYEDEVVEFRDFLQANAPDELNFDFRECEDIHLAILQLIMAYKKIYSCNYQFSSNKKLYETVLRGFDTSENHCN